MQLHIALQLHATPELQGVHAGAWEANRGLRLPNSTSTSPAAGPEAAPAPRVVSVSFSLLYVTCTAAQWIGVMPQVKHALLCHWSVMLPVEPKAGPDATPASRVVKPSVDSLLYVTCSTTLLANPPSLFLRAMPGVQALGSRAATMRLWQVAGMCAKIASAGASMLHHLPLVQHVTLRVLGTPPPARCLIGTIAQLPNLINWAASDLMHPAPSTSPCSGCKSSLLWRVALQHAGISRHAGVCCRLNCRHQTAWGKPHARSLSFSRFGAVRM